MSDDLKGAKETMQPPKKAISDEERLALAEKMDKDLDAWMDGLEKRAYTDGWPEDKWEEVKENLVPMESCCSRCLISMLVLTFYIFLGNGKTSLLYDTVP